MKIVISVISAVAPDPNIPRIPWTMMPSVRFLVAESETEEDRENRRNSSGRSSGESYGATLKSIVPDAECEIVQPVETNGRERASAASSDYDAVFLTGSPLHVYKDSPEVRR